MIALLLALAAPPMVSATEQAVRGAHAQADAWNRGDLEGAISAYCDQPDIVWINKSGVSRGFDEFAASMRDEFQDRSGMGKFGLEILNARALGGDTALLSVRWAITRDGRRLMGGVSTQLWQRCEGRLRIVLEHAS